MYTAELAQMMATWITIYDLGTNIGTLYITFFLLKRIGFYKRIPIGVRTKN